MRICQTDAPQRKRREDREERLQRKILRKNHLSESFESALEKAEMECNCNSRKSEIDFSRQQIAMSYLAASINEVD